MKDLAAVGPELFILISACIVLIADLFFSEKQKVFSYVLAQLGIMGAFLLTWSLFQHPPVTAFHGHVIVDRFSCVAKFFIELCAFLAFVYSRDYLKDRGMFRGEFYALGLFSILGMMVICSAQSVLVLYLGVELLSLPLYAMVAMRTDCGVSAEAGMKYFVLGALASGLMLYGISLLFGMTHSIMLPEIAHVIQIIPASDQVVIAFSLVFIVAGLAFKLGAVPFHLWVPDVYEGAPTAVTLFISAAPKLAALALAFRFLHDGFMSVKLDWQQLFAVVSLLSIAIGNLAAIAQTNIKRMLAYSAIAQIGYLLLGLLPGTDAGFSATFFYMICYTVMSSAAFGIIIFLSRAGFEAENISDFKGLNKRSPWLAFLMMIVMFSMAGIPPTVGFFAKLSIFVVLMKTGYINVMIFAMLFAVVGAYYYLRVIRTMYFEEPEDSALIEISADKRIVISLNGLALLLLGVMPAGLMQLCQSVF